MKKKEKKKKKKKKKKKGNVIMTLKVATVEIVNLLTAPRTVSKTHAHVPQSQWRAKHVQFIWRLPHVQHVMGHGTAARLIIVTETENKQ